MTAIIRSEGEIERERLRRVNAGLRKALDNLLGAAKLMPRATPAAGGAGTVHSYLIEAAYVWALDRACKDADAVLNPESTK